MMWPAGTAAVVIRILAFAAFVAGAVGLLDLVGLAGGGRRTPSDPDSVKVSTRRLAVGTLGVCIATCALLFFGGLAFVRGVRAPSGQAPEHRRDRVQRPPGAVRQAHQRRRLRRHPQLDVGQQRGLHRRQPESAASSTQLDARRAGLRARPALRLPRRPVGERRTCAWAPEHHRSPSRPVEQEVVNRVLAMRWCGVAATASRTCATTCASSGALKAEDWVRPRSTTSSARTPTRWC